MGIHIESRISVSKVIKPGIIQIWNVSTLTWKSPKLRRWSCWVLVTFHSKRGCDSWMLLRRGWVVGLRTNDRQVSAQSPSRLSLRHYRTAPVLLTKAGRFSCLCSLSSHSSSPWCAGQGGLRVRTLFSVQGRKVHWGRKWSKIRSFSLFF